MHSGIILLAVCSMALIVLMVTCFVCFIRSRRKEDEEFMQQVQFQQQDYASQLASQNQQQGEPVQQHQAAVPSNLQMIQDELLRQDSGQKQARADGGQSESYEQVISQQQQRQQQMGRQSPYSAAAAAYATAAASSPYHSQQAQAQRQQETRSDMTQQINSAIIGSSEAEFQNDFIQVFPMYQIAPQPEKNTTPYLT